MASTRSRTALVTMGGFLVTLGMLASLLSAYVVFLLHEPLALGSFRPWLTPDAFMLGLSLGTLGGAVSWVASVVAARRPEARPSPSPAASTQVVPAPAPGLFERFTLPISKSYILLTVDEARDIETMVNDVRGRAAYLEDRLMAANQLLGERTTKAFMEKLSPSTTPTTTPTPSTTEDMTAVTTRKRKTGPNGYPVEICERCGREFEQTILARARCPDCWSLEEYLSKPASSSSSRSVVAHEPAVDPYAVALDRLDKTPALLPVLHHVSQHPKMKVVDYAKDLGLTRGTTSGRINDLVRLGLLEKSDGGFEVTEMGEKAAKARPQATVGAGAGAAPAVIPPP